MRAAGFVIVLHCPGCHRGRCGRPVVERGVRLLAATRTRRVGPKGQRRVVYQRAAACGDCGHSWWTVRCDTDLKIAALIDRQRQLPLPHTGVPLATL